jgi:sugar phosphate isomerase/epimerase
MMTKPIALQLYSVRERLSQNFDENVRAIAEMGYLGVETAGFAGTTPAAAADLFRSLGLTVTSMHSPLPLGDQRAEVVETGRLLNCSNIVCAYIPPEEFATLDQIKRHCDRLNEANVNARADGMTLFYHNHWWEYEPVEGVYPYRLMAEQCDPTIKFEIDAYWVATAGCDVIAVLDELGDRVTLLHVKDGPRTTQDPMVAVGEGSLDYHAIIPAAGAAEWMIVELDRCASSMIDAVRASYNYLTREGLAHGR